MSYMIKHPINAKPFKMATAYNNVDYTIAIGVPYSVTLSLNTLVQSTDMGLTLNANTINLVADKTYLIYFKSGLTNSTVNRSGDIYIRKNGVNVSSQPIVFANTNASIIGASAWTTPRNIAMAVLTASAGDYVSFYYTRTSGNSYSDTVNSASTKAFILEIG